MTTSLKKPCFKLSEAVNTWVIFLKWAGQGCSLFWDCPHPRPQASSLYKFTFYLQESWQDAWRLFYIIYYVVRPWSGNKVKIYLQWSKQRDLQGEAQANMLALFVDLGKVRRVICKKMTLQTFRLIGKWTLQQWSESEHCNCDRKVNIATMNGKWTLQLWSESEHCNSDRKVNIATVIGKWTLQLWSERVLGFRVSDHSCNVHFPITVAMFTFHSLLQCSLSNQSECLQSHLFADHSTNLP